MDVLLAAPGRSFFVTTGQLLEFEEQVYIGLPFENGGWRKVSKEMNYLAQVASNSDIIGFDFC